MLASYNLALSQLELPAERLLINQYYHADEYEVITQLLKNADLTPTQKFQIQEQAKIFITNIRNTQKKITDIDMLLTQYSLARDEGIALLSLAEALLRIPDTATLDTFMRDKIGAVDWQNIEMVNATTWALILTGKILTPQKAGSLLNRILFTVANRLGVRIVHKLAKKAMHIMSQQFVSGRSINEALANACKMKTYRFSYDMLGEAALTEEDALRYFKAYHNSIIEIGKVAIADVYQNPGISIKLSALHPRYEEGQKLRVLKELTPKLLSLAQAAKKANISLTVDAEESERLELSLDIIEQVFNDQSLNDWYGFGVALQAYQKRALPLLEWLADLGKKRRIMVRLLKGAYWDSEIKKTQILGLKDYPVFTHKEFTDVSFQACAKKILDLSELIYPQFATHNAYSAAMILNLAGDYRDFEFQRLYGMGQSLYDQIVATDAFNIPCRLYAPVGSYSDLLPYLVRRLLENGANSSFVNQIIDPEVTVDTLVVDPVGAAKTLLPQLNNNIPLPANLFLPLRKNSPGFDFTDRSAVAKLQQHYQKANYGDWQAASLIAGSRRKFKGNFKIYTPMQKEFLIGLADHADDNDVALALKMAASAVATWGQSSVAYRVDLLIEFANLLEQNIAQLLALLCMEGGKTWQDAEGELRETIDYCYYYGSLAKSLMQNPVSLQGYTGELNELSYHPRGIMVAISPWNFPLAIFSGQIIAALVTGNCVIAKPAEQTSLIAYFTIKLMHQAGFPNAVVQLLVGSGAKLGPALISDQRIKGVIFTGSTQTATKINQTLAARAGEIVPLIAETGGQNAMIVDSSALLEQVVVDVISSAFGSAGQRCSALRVLYVQEDIYKRFINLLVGAMLELQIGNPQWLSTDIGPVIDAAALEKLLQHVTKFKGQIIYQCTLDTECQNGNFMAPTVLAIPHINILTEEVFGPILHIVRFKSTALDTVIAQINSTGYGLTFGLHSRINSRIANIRQQINVGNCYVNRAMTGAVVGVQPFGGEGLSGTGPKAGGPNYLLRLCHERTYTINTTAFGGNTSLLAGKK